MSQQQAHNTQAGKACAFEIILDEARGTEPGQLDHLKQPTLRPVTPAKLEEKQRKADERRKAYELARFERMQEREDTCRKLNDSVTVLLDPNSQRQDRRAAMQSATQQFTKITKCRDFQTPK